MQFEGKTVWITGASSGIGRELALQLSALGAQLVLSSRRHESLEEVRLACDQPQRHFCLPLDLAASENFGPIVDQAWQHGGGVDILVNNGGISQRGLALDTALSVDRQIMEVDYFGTIALTKLVAPRMIESGSGHIVTIASVAGKLGSPMRSAYSGAKHAIVGFMDCLRVEIAGTGVQVHVVCPGWVQTDVSRNALTANGEVSGEEDPEVAAGIPVDAFVRQMLSALRRDTAEIVIAAGKARLGYHLRRLLPNTYHWMLARIYPS